MARFFHFAGQAQRINAAVAREDAMRNKLVRVNRPTQAAPLSEPGA